MNKDSLAASKIGVAFPPPAPPVAYGKANIKVIGAGWGRTGTSSFKKALEILYEGKCYHMDEANKHSDFAFWIRCAEKDAVDFDEVFDRESWYKSCCDTIFQMNPRSPHSNPGIRAFMWVMGGKRPMVSDKVIFTHSLGRSWNKKDVISAYMAHVQNVKESLGPEILVFEAKDGWAPLCEYLGVPIPDVPYPRVNDTEAFNGVITRTTATGYVLGTLLLGIPFLLESGSGR